MVEPEQLHALVESCVQFARTQLIKHGQFYPFGVVIDAEGQLIPRVASDGAETPDPRGLYEILTEALRVEATDGEIAAAALVANVDIPAAYDPVWPDGLRVQLEAEGYSRFIYVPYRIAPADAAGGGATVEVSPPFAVESEAGVFVNAAAEIQ